MTPSSDVQQKLRRYLLGKLAEQEREDIETTLFTDDDVLEELLILEDEITDEYLSNKLDPVDQSAFERHFLVTPERHRELAFASALRRHLARPSPQPTWWPGFLSTQPPLVRGLSLALILAIVSATAWLLLLRNPGTPQSLATLTLTPTQATRSEGSEPSKLKLPLRESGLKIVMVLPQASPGATRYRAQVDTESGNILNADASRENDQSVSITLPAARLTAGRYIIKLFVTESNGAERRISGNYLFMLE